MYQKAQNWRFQRQDLTPDCQTVNPVFLCMCQSKHICKYYGTGLCELQAPSDFPCSVTWQCVKLLLVKCYSRPSFSLFPLFILSCFVSVSDLQWANRKILPKYSKSHYEVIQRTRWRREDGLQVGNCKLELQPDWTCSGLSRGRYHILGYC